MKSNGLALKNACLSILFSCLVFFASVGTALAQQNGVLVHTGTGFFVSLAGHIITNHHVVEGCDEVMIRGSIPDATAEVINVDKEFDLALLRTKARTRRIATIRHPGASKIREGEEVLVIGYPGKSSMTGEYQVAETHVVGVKGPLDEPHWIQFAESAQPGNSGGPLLDTSGNVAGVVVGKTTVTRFNALSGSNEVISESDIAISLPILLKFLQKNVVGFRFNGSYTFMRSKQVEELTRPYIVSIICPQQ